MEDEEELENDDEDRQIGTDHDQQQPISPTITNGSDGPGEFNHQGMNEDDEQQQPQTRPPLILTSTHQRKRMLPYHRRPIMNEKSDLFSVRNHLERGSNRNR